MTETATTTAPPPVWQPPKTKPAVVALLVVALILTVTLILQLWGIGPIASRIQQTDNALVRGRTTNIAPQVSGYVAKVLVRDFQNIEAGQLLVLIDDDIYRARVAQARANLDSQIAALANSHQAHEARIASIAGQVATIADAEAQLLKAKADMARASDLVSDGAISVRERDQTSAALAQAEARLQQANAAMSIAHQDLRSVDVGRGGLPHRSRSPGPSCASRRSTCSTLSSTRPSVASWARCMFASVSMSPMAAS
jgi:multidrug resistance efflux pump